MGSSSSRVSAPGEQDARELDPPPLPSRERAQRLAEQALLDPERRRDLGGLGLGGVATGCVQRGVGVLVATHRPVPDVRVVAPHLGLRVPQAAYDVIESSRRQDPVAREHLEVAGARVLREVADRARRRDRPTGRQGLAREDPRQRGLAGSVAADQPDAVARGDPEGDVVHQQARTSAHLELGDSDHDRLSGWG